MSVVTDILLCTAIEDGALVKDQHPNADMVSAWLVHRHGPGCELKKLDDYTGGKWAMQCDVFGVAVNYCDTDGLVAAFRAVRWEHPESAQLLVKEEDWDSFRVFTAGGADARHNQTPCAPPAVSAEELVQALQLILHATAPTPEGDGGHHEAAYELAMAALKRVEARREYEAKYLPSNMEK